MTAPSASAGGQPARGFATACNAAFKAPLAGCGFTLVRGMPAKIGFLAQRIYRAGDRHVRVSATTHPAEAPAHCALAVRRGVTRVPRGRLETIALWQLATEGKFSSGPAAEAYLLRERCAKGSPDGPKESEGRDS